MMGYRDDNGICEGTPHIVRPCNAQYRRRDLLGEKSDGTG